MPPIRFFSSPYTASEWQRIAALGHQVDRLLQDAVVGLTMGGEPTFVSSKDFESPQWRTEALGDEKLRIAARLLRQLEKRFSAPGSLKHYGLGKLYPGEEAPRWALGCYWRQDGVPLLTDPQLQAQEATDCGHTQATAEQFASELVRQLGVSASGLMSVHDREGDEWAGYVLPLLPVRHSGELRGGELRWSTCRWILSDELKILRLLQGRSQLGLRLPLQAIDWSDPLAEEAQAHLGDNPIVTAGPPLDSPPNSIGIALGLEVRLGTLRVFLPPLSSPRSYVDLLQAIERTAQVTNTHLLIEGYPPPANAGICGFQLTPDPGVLEVNIHPMDNWGDLVEQTEILYEEARACGLCARRLATDGRWSGTGGGAHITIGGHTPQSSPLLRRPDLLRSLMGYWQNHPSLSYLFSGKFVGPTSPAPRLDEARLETLYELELAFTALHPDAQVEPEVLDSLLGHLLVDSSGNAHRTALCIDKLYPQRNPALQLGLLEFRGFAMPPNAPLRSLQLLLVRSLVAMFWQQPYTDPLIRWGTQLHDRFLLPHYIRQDLREILADLNQAGFHFQPEWFEPYFDFRFPVYGEVTLEMDGGETLQLQLRQAIEPWNAIDGEANNGGTSRTVDASLERLQVRLQGPEGEQTHRFDVTCNGCVIPFADSNIPGVRVGGVRFRVHQTIATSHPALVPHPCLTFEVVDRRPGRSLGGCSYYPNSQLDITRELPQTPEEAAERMAQRFVPHGPRPETVPCHSVPISSEYPSLLDLRRVRASSPER